MHDHLIFFDAECNLCKRAVHKIIEMDKEELFVFAPLNGKTAQDLLKGSQEPLKEANSLVLVEKYRSQDQKFWIRSKAVLRVYWLMGGIWMGIGIFCFFPSFLGDAIYRWVATHRHHLLMKTAKKSQSKGRFLP